MRKRRRKRRKNLKSGIVPFPLVLNIGSPRKLFYSLKKEEIMNLDKSIC